MACLRPAESLAAGENMSANAERVYAPLRMLSRLDISLEYSLLPWDDWCSRVRTDRRNQPLRRARGYQMNLCFRRQCARHAGQFVTSKRAHIIIESCCMWADGHMLQNHVDLEPTLRPHSALQSVVRTLDAMPMHRHPICVGAQQWLCACRCATRNTGLKTQIVLPGSVVHYSHNNPPDCRAHRLQVGHE